ncbi:uncharacterized protein [Choristoneura fumiferana]|uniref:uncharacterized protein n=1 Tax=Choristoneura fumiferana TaxID=7141 RepID=UPI003D156CA5
MYRTLILCLVAATAGAPQDAAITYVQQQPLVDETLPSPSYRSSRIENIPLTFPRSADKEIEEDILDSDVSDDSERRNVRAEPTTDSTVPDIETTEAVTEKYEPKTTVYEVKTKAPPKFYSKLSYFEKAKDLNSVVTNLVERPGRRRFRSRCRCERISNCPKLQITVPRCPEEQFMCCF